MSEHLAWSGIPCPDPDCRDCRSYRPRPGAAEDINELARWVNAQLVADEQAYAAAIVRGQTGVEFRGIEGHHEVVSARMAWDDLRPRKQIAMQHLGRNPLGRCWGCSKPWPCETLGGVLRRWWGRPGWRDEWRHR